MPFTISPGVLSREIDLTTVVPTIATTRGGFAGPFLWGPVGDPQNGTVQNDTQLQETFWRKNEATAVSYLSASNFLRKILFTISIAIILRCIVHILDDGINLYYIQCNLWDTGK